MGSHILALKYIKTRVEMTQIFQQKIHNFVDLLFVNQLCIFKVKMYVTVGRLCYTGTIFEPTVNASVEQNKLTLNFPLPT